MPLWLASSLKSSAVIVAGSNGANGTNSDPAQLQNIASGFYYEDNIISFGGGTGIYLGSGISGDAGYVLTAAHLGNLSAGTDIGIAGENYKVISRSQINSADLNLYKIDTNPTGQLPNLPNVSIASVHPSINEQILMTGRGARTQGTDYNPNTSDMVVQSGRSIYNTAAASSQISFGLNNIAGDVPWAMNSATANWFRDGYSGSEFYARFNDPGSGNYTTTWEGVASRGDSGGPVFIKRNNEWELAGITSALYRGGNPNNTVAFNNLTSFSNLAAYSSDLPELGGFGSFTNVPEPSTMFLVATGASAIIARRRRTPKPPT